MQIKKKIVNGYAVDIRLDKGPGEFYTFFMYPLRYLPSGHVYIDPNDDCDMVIDALLETDYSEEFCLARDFTEDFVTRLMEAGFLVMSAKLEETGEGDEEKPAGHGSAAQDPFYLLLPKLCRASG